MCTAGCFRDAYRHNYSQGIVVPPEGRSAVVYWKLYAVKGTDNIAGDGDIISALGVAFFILTPEKTYCI